MGNAIDYVWPWLKERVSERKKSGFASNKPLVIGLSGPQGSGKTTLVNTLVNSARSSSLKAINISIDDFYLPRAEQDDLAKKYFSCDYLQQRGYPGTHDISLGTRTINKLINALDGDSVIIPRYNKAAFNGLGDRFPQSQWTQTTGNLDVILWEGWMLGFQPIGKTCPAPLKEIDHLLAAYESWYKLIDYWVYIFPDDFTYVFQWRLESEQNLRAQTGSGMSDIEVTKYIEKFMIAYKTYGNPLYQSLKNNKNNLILAMDKQRLCRLLDNKKEKRD